MRLTFFVGFKELNSTTHEVFPYSIFYVYYEQYLTIWRDTVVSLSISFVTIFVISFFLMGFNVGSALVIILTIFMIVMDLIGLLYFWNISLNAITLVNLVMVCKNTTTHSSVSC
jgi:Niemann-Pick C1 protein